VCEQRKKSPLSSHANRFPIKTQISEMAVAAELQINASHTKEITADRSGWIITNIRKLQLRLPIIDHKMACVCSAPLSRPITARTEKKVIKIT
jgi:hypothetical protein